MVTESHERTESRATHVTPESPDVQIEVPTPTAASFVPSADEAIEDHGASPGAVRIVQVAPASADVHTKPLGEALPLGFCKPVKLFATAASFCPLAEDATNHQFCVGLCCGENASPGSTPPGRARVPIVCPAFCASFQRISVSPLTTRVPPAAMVVGSAMTTSSVANALMVCTKYLALATACLVKVVMGSKPAGTGFEDAPWVGPGEAFGGPPPALELSPPPPPQAARSAVNANAVTSRADLCCWAVVNFSPCPTCLAKKFIHTARYKPQK